MTKEVFLKQVHGITLAARGNSNHWVMMDGSPEFGGSLAGSSPKELLLMALAGCTSMDVIPILKKRRAPIEGYEVRVTGNEREEHPRIFTDIHLEYVFYGDGINPVDVERAIELSRTKYCAVSAIVAASARITHSYRIESSVKAASSVGAAD
jgi:putative redox protein